MTKPLKASVFCLIMALLVHAGARAEEGLDIPEGLKDKALTVSIKAFVVQGGASPVWQSESTRFTMPGTPVSVKLVGANVIILVQVTPYEGSVKGALVLVTQGQVWVKRPSGELSYRTSVDTVSVHYGEKVIFFPLGRKDSGETPMRLEIFVDRYRGLEGKKLNENTEQPPDRPLPPPPAPSGGPTRPSDQTQAHGLSDTPPEAPSK